MDTQTLRNLEKLFALMEIRRVQIGPRMEFRDGPARIFVELSERRVLLSTSMPVALEHSQGTLARLLSRWSPGFTDGVPLRAFAIEDAVVVSCAMPEDGQAELWFRVMRAQRKLLEACLKEQEE